MNLLENESSPYLRQHRTNPVWWRPWGNDAFQKAQKENKLIFLSVGYSTCHWCHVMEKDSFEKSDVALALNTDFIAIKVDREERPDVDALYMNAVQAMSGSGGWPMSVFLTPDGKPFWGGTFIPKANFLEILKSLSHLWKTEPEKITSGSNELFKLLNEGAQLPSLEAAALTQADLHRFYENFRERYDSVYGGTRGAPKFPPTLALQALLRIYKSTQNADALNMVTHTLMQMRRGGIYDHLGGGFHRYATDEIWHTPHFEKMLYDNALLAETFVEAFQVTKNPEFKQTACETLDYLLREMRSEDGGFFSAEDADSENIEGKFYVWSEEELKSKLQTEEFEFIKNLYSVSGRGSFEAVVTGDEVKPRDQRQVGVRGHILALRAEQALPAYSATHKKLLEIRSERVRPHRDEKILTSWNGLALSAFSKAASAWGEHRYLEAAQQNAHFILEKLVTQDAGDATQLWRSLFDNQKSHRALSEDYALFIQGLLDLYSADFDKRWLNAALRLQKTLDRDFYNTEAGGYFDSDNRDKNLIVRHQTFEDGVVPCANSVACLNLLRLEALTGEQEFKIKAQKILQRSAVLATRYPQAVAKLMQAIDRVTNGSCELIVIDPNETPKESFLNVAHEIGQNFWPHLTVACGSEKDRIQGITRPAIHEKRTYYFCENRRCDLPDNDFQNVLKKISKKKGI